VPAGGWFINIPRVDADLKGGGRVNKVITGYVKGITATSIFVGKVAQYIVFGMIGVLFFETVSRTIFNHPWIFSVELAQFIMAAYYTLGGAYTLLIDGHVRMDLLYGKWTPKQKAVADALTFVLIMLYLVLLLLGGFISLEYSMKYKQKSYSSWAPPVTPIKIIMLFGMTLMALQVIAEFFKDLARARGKEPQ
jgi:TRAP-type mannitol/chloroaromatic compound transport system permease small subunit